MKKLLLAALLCLFCCLNESCQSVCDPTCQNGGKCNKKTCECPGRYGGVACDVLCPVGYEGTNCDVLSRTKFIRTWNAKTTNTLGLNVNHQMAITAGATFNRIVISNVNNEGFSVVAVVGGATTFEISTQNATGSYTGPVNGSGYITDGKLGINITKQGTSYFSDCNP